MQWWTVLVLAAMPSGAIAGDPQGIWLTEGRDAAIAIGSCGGGEPPLCGRIVWLLNATDESGRPRRDGRNPDAGRQSRAICGLMVMSGLNPSGPNSWDGGTVYNPQDGRLYSGDIALLGDAKLRVRAYLAVPFFGQTQVWTRAERSAAGIVEYDCRYVRVPPAVKND
jgi:uncharacterized protein (DUF2147 family)